jgi:large subunit ribosomal protein L4
VRLVKDFGVKEPRTKAVVDLLGRFDLPRPALLVTGEADRNLLLSARNVPSVKVLPADYLNVVDILTSRVLLMTVPAVRRAEALWGAERAKKRRAPISPSA